MVDRQYMASGGHGCEEGGFLSCTTEHTAVLRAVSMRLLSLKTRFLKQHVFLQCVFILTFAKGMEYVKSNTPGLPYHSILILILSPSGLLVFPEKRKDKRWYGGGVGVCCADTT